MIVNGLFGHVYDENGNEVDTSQEFTSALEFNKSEYMLPGKFLSVNQVNSGKGTGSLKYLMRNSALVRKIAENPRGKYTYIGKLDDPNVDGQEAIMYKGVSFDSAPLQGWTLGDNVEKDIPFTFDDYEYVESMP